MRIDEPPWTVGLPRMSFHEDLPGPVSIVPGQLAPDYIRLRALGLRRACSICGYPMSPDRPVYRMWTCEPPPDQTVFRMGGMSPMHRSCAIYSALSCPHLRHAEARGHYSEPRGEMTILGFRRYGLIFKDDGPPEIDGWGYLDYCDLIPCGESWRELVPAYEQALADDHIDTSYRLHWTGGTPDDDARLAECAREDEATVERMRALIPPPPSLMFI